MLYLPVSENCRPNIVGESTAPSPSSSDVPTMRRSLAICLWRWEPVTRQPIRSALSYQMLFALVARFCCLPNTISSTRLQKDSATFGSSEDSPLVTRISGPNAESVAVRLTII